MNNKKQLWRALNFVLKYENTKDAKLKKYLRKVLDEAFKKLEGESL